MPDDDYVYDEDSGEWLPASELAAKQAAAKEGDTVEVRDAVGLLLHRAGVGIDEDADRIHRPTACGRTPRAGPGP